ncbi:vitellogenin-like [Protopterus annectens]|uniref:Vtg1 n=1 Tax=Protopterus annectens TaxID=7888 RepID=A0A386GY32_PROAN|nr:vitellogenin-like [Protopterus annectens]AYD38000.1 Vtg1 [Protopterus annectens]
MKAIAFTLILILVKKGSQSNIEPVFSQSKTYEYQYEGLIFNGPPEKGLARAGMKIVCKVEISYLAPQYYLLKIQSPSLGEYNGIWPTSVFHSAPKLSQALAHQLTEPVKFEYSKGRVGNVFTAQNVSDTVANVQRGIVSMFQITVKKGHNVYDVQEAGIEGVCQSNYLIQEGRKSSKITVTKSRDFNSCQETNSKSTGMAYTESCVACQQMNKNLQGNIIYTYTLKHKDGGSLITEGRSQAIYRYTPFGEQSGAAITEARQQLTLTDEKKIPNKQLQNYLSNRGTVMYHFAPDVFRNPFQLLGSEKVETQIMNVLKDLELNNTKHVHSDVPAKFLLLVQLLRLADHGNIETVWKRYEANSEIRRWILDAICAAATADALKFLGQILQKAKITHVEGSLLLIPAMHMAIPDQRTINIASEILSSHYVQKHQLLRKMVILAYGSMVYRYCKGPDICPEWALQTLHELTSQAADSKKETEIIVALRALGNAGQPASIKHIHKFLPGFSSSASRFPIRIKVESVLALRNIAKKDPKKVQDIAVQILLNQKHAAEVRMAAGIVLFNSQPSLSLLTAVANCLQKESNLQVLSFIYSYMKALMRSTLPDHLNVAAACNVAVKLLSSKFDRLSYRYSRAFHFHIFKNIIRSGASVDFYVLNTAATVLPSAVVSVLRTYFANLKADILEVGIHTEGLQEFLSKHSAQNEDSSVTNKTQQILKKLPGWKELPGQKPLASAYLKLFGQSVVCGKVKKEDIHHLLQALNDSSGSHISVHGIIDSLQQGIQVQWSKSVLAPELRYIVPTIVGLPLEVMLYASAVSTAKINFQVQSTPRPQKPFKLDELRDANITLKLEILPSASVHAVAKMGISTPYFHSAIELQSNTTMTVPLNIKASANIREEHFKIEMEPNQREKKIATMRAQAFAVSENTEDVYLNKRTPVLQSKTPTDVIKKNNSSKEYTSTEVNINDQSYSDYLRDYAPDSGNMSENHSKASQAAYMACINSTILGAEICFQATGCHPAFIRNALLDMLIGDYEAEISIKPVLSNDPIEKVRIEVHWGNKTMSDAKEIILTEALNSRSQTVSSNTKKILYFAKHKGKRLSDLSNSQKHSHTDTSSRSGISSSSSDNRKTHKSSQYSSEHKSSEERRHGKNHMSSSTSKESSSGSSSSRTSNESHQKKLGGHLLDHVDRLPFPKNNNANSSSDDESSQEITFPGDHSRPLFTIIFQAKSSHHRQQGYQTTVYQDLKGPKPQVQIYTKELNNSSAWRACTGVKLLSSSKAVAVLKWGQKCKDYNIAIKAETGHFANNPTLQLKLQWNKIPQAITAVVRMTAEYAPGIAFMLGLTQMHDHNPSHQLSVALTATSPRTLDLTVKAPLSTFCYSGLWLPFALPFSKNMSSTQLPAAVVRALSNIPDLITNSDTAECTSDGNTLTTFNNVKLEYETPLDCYLILALDCSPNPRFLIMVKRTEEVSSQMEVKVKLANLEIEMTASRGPVRVILNGEDISLHSATYVVGTAVLERNQDGINMFAAEHGIEYLHYSGKIFKVRVSPWMKKRTCGVCGHNDGETQMEFRKPSGLVAPNAMSFVHSWAVPGETCSGTCKMKHEFLKLEKQIRLYGEESKCYSVDPVLRCLPGCSPLKNATVVVGFHCVPADSGMNWFEIQNNFEPKVQDLKDIVTTHTACSCNVPQCETLA